MSNDFIKRFETLEPVLSKYVHRASSGDFADMNLSFSQIMTLGLICQMKDPKMKELAAELGVTLGNVTGIIDRLKASGYVKRQEDASDRRVVRVSLTSKGRATAKRVLAHKKKCMEKIFCKLSASDKTTIIKVLEKLVEQIKKEGA